MGTCFSKQSVTGSPARHVTHTTEPPTPSSSEASIAEASIFTGLHDLQALGPRAARQSYTDDSPSALEPHEVQQAAYQLAMRLNGTPIKDPRERQRLADATATVHETRLALHRGRGNVASDLRHSGGRSATYSSLSYCLGEADNHVLAGSALAVGAGNCDHNAVINARRHAARMEDGGQVMSVRDDEENHLYALYKPPSVDAADESAVILDSWCDGPAVLLRDSHWAKNYGKTTKIIEQFDRNEAIDALTRSNAVKDEIEDPRTALHTNARELEKTFLANPAPGVIFFTKPVIDTHLAESTRQRLQEYSPRSREVLAADAARQAYGLNDPQATSPRTTAAILKDAEHLDALSRPPMSW